VSNSVARAATALTAAGILAGGILAASAPSTEVLSGAGEGGPVSVVDAIEMVRIQDRFGLDREFVAISPDGSRLATVVWRGDLDRGVNLHSILIIDVESARVTPRRWDDAVLSVPFAGDSLDQAARPIDQLTFLGDNRTLVFRGALDGGPRQVHSVDVETADVRTLTRHPTDVRAYAVTDEGSVRLYMATVPHPEDTARANRLRRDGGSAYDRDGLANGYLFAAAANLFPPTGLAFNPSGRELRGYYAPGEDLDEGPTVIFAPADPGPSRGDLQRYFAGGTPPRGSLPSLFQLGAPEAPAPPGWDPMRWVPVDGQWVMRRGDTVALAGWDGHVWSTPRPIGTLEGLNRYRAIATDGRQAVGVVDGPADPPELAALDLATGEIRTLTDLNPRLRTRTHGQVRQIRFGTPFNALSTAWVVTPVDFQDGRQYPLVVLHANETERADNRSYLIDGRLILSGHAVQPLAAAGFVVLFIGAPPGRLGAPQEGEAMRAHTEAAIRTLAREGYVDTLRVGVAGFSRSAYYTEHLLMHSDFSFAAAIQIDGGSAEYMDRLRPYSDEELARVRAPFLAQAHGPLQLAYQGAMTDRLRAMGAPSDLLYFPTAPHTTLNPGHRLTALTTHVDWWRFWLQDYEDPAPTKVGQYRRWRDLKSTQYNERTGPASRSR
jgi:dienelactone hydrolase